jgi:hypothetical protein
MGLRPLMVALSRCGLGRFIRLHIRNGLRFHLCALCECRACACARMSAAITTAAATVEKSALTVSVVAVFARVMPVT